MLGIQNLELFIITGLLLNMAPGPDSLLVMSRSATQGWKAGSAAALGIGSGTFIHVFAAALGLSALLAASATAFLVIKYLGAAYLLYIGISMLLSKSPTTETQATPVLAPRRYTRLYLQGFLTNVLNPKVALFFLAFVPQFIAADAEHKALAFIVLGCIFNFNGMLWCHLLAVSTAFASRHIQASQRITRWLNRTIGAVFVALGVKLALSK
ncbi:LysE family translocator [Pseudomonas sp. M30-35]|uniref:LysE family translocator n=1 Tax=Pseudomonas sp. M30-35 TaxID=1981174 RepID=UPI000B3C8FA4|nr:LysE family translocator [Pseudomonas sp. M30-35]ARU89396.1 lysine transporter LysE [Pseudomonas sp. M30-35]